MEFDAASQAPVAGATSTGGDETPLLRTVSADEEDVEPIDLGPVVRKYINADAVTEWDVLSERGGRGNHHPGNIRYREKVREMKPEYENACKTRKTEIAEEIVEYVHSQHSGRFLKKDEDGHYYVMTDLESRRKASQALREKSKMTNISVSLKRHTNDVEEDGEEDGEEDVGEAVWF